MEQDFKVSQEYIAILKRYKYHIFAITTIGLILSILIAKTLPHMYKSTATILIDQSGMPKDIVKSMVTNYAEHRIQIIRKKIMSSENLKGMIDKFSLYPEGKDRSIRALINTMRKDTHMEMVRGNAVIDQRSGQLIKPTIGFKLSFDNKSPEVAQKIANEFVSLYLDANVNQRAKVIKGATTFLQQETTKLHNEIKVLEEKIASFKEANAASLPSLNEVNLGRIDRIEQKINDTSTNIRSLTDRVSQLRNQLYQLEPNTSTYSSTGQRIYGINDRLAMLQAEYAALSSKYSQGHPDLVKMRKEIASLEKQTGGAVGTDEYYVQLDDKKAKLALLMNRYSSGHPDVKKLKLEIRNIEKIISQPVKNKPKNNLRKPNNPAYIQIQSEIMANQAEINSLKIARTGLENKLLRYEKVMTQSPQVEREYKSLMRDYENATAKHREVKSKLMEASMTESMEKGTKGNEFVLLEPPLVPEDPFEPNRTAIAFLGLLASIAAAFGFVVVKESLNPSVYTAGRLASVIGVQPLVSIPYLESEKVLLKKQSNIKIVLLIIGILLISTILWYVMVPKE